LVYEDGARARGRCSLAAEGMRWLRSHEDRRRDFRIVAVFPRNSLAFDFAAGRMRPVLLTRRRVAASGRPRSRLDGFIDRMKAQRDCLDAAGAALSLMPGDAVELGVGAGRTLDHILGRCPGASVHLFDWKIGRVTAPVVPHVGDIRETLPAHAAANRGRAKLVHSDVVGGPEADPRLMLDLADQIVRLLASGGFLVSNTETLHGELRPLALPKGIRKRKYFMYVKV
jgi:hypothetical protein